MNHMGCTVNLTDFLFCVVTRITEYKKPDKPFTHQEVGYSHGSHDGSTIQMRRHVSCTEECGGLSLRSKFGAAWAKVVYDLVVPQK